MTEITGGAWTRGEIYASGKHVATYNSGTTYWDHADWLGTERARTTVSGTIAETCTSLPFGDGLTCSNSDPSPMHFTGKQRDTESGLDDFDARYYTSSLGRFMTPDWEAHQQAVPYAVLTSPQTLNLYAYVSNNPTTDLDADGHMVVICSGGCQNGQKNNGTATNQTPANNAPQPTSPPAQNNKTVTVTVDQVKSNQPFGHATVSVGGDKPVGLVPNSDAKAAAAAAVEVKTGIPVSVAGHIAEDNRKPEAQAKIQVTPDQAKAMRTYITQAEHSNQGYDPGFRNCANFVEEVLRSGGVKAPNDMTPGGLVGDLQKQNQ